jgi:hypothetical protein
MSPRTSRSRAYAPDPGAPGHACDKPGCTASGDYRAPKSRSSLREYWWFCLEHVREYNLAWDFYKGMTPGQIEAQMREDVIGHRPSWPLGHLGNSAWTEALQRDPLSLLSGLGGGKQRPRPHEAPEELRQPLATLGLAWPATLDQLKSRYKELAKRHHPDANGGDKGAEERLKTINLAYAALRTKLQSEPRIAQAASG